MSGHKMTDSNIKFYNTLIPQNIAGYSQLLLR